MVNGWIVIGYNKPTGYTTDVNHSLQWQRETFH